MLTLKSGLIRDLTGNFILDEDALRRIVGILAAKGKELAFPNAVVFHVKREDDRFYETTTLEDVLSDANTPGHRIQLVAIELRDTTPGKAVVPWERDWIVSVQFTTVGRTQRIEVASENRSWALLLADELGPQVVRTFSAKKIPSLILIASYIAMGVGLFALAKSYAHLMPFDGLTIVKTALIMVFGFLSIATLQPRERFVAHWTGPESSFHWGEQRTSYGARESVRKNILWVVIAGFFVSVGATLYTNLLAPGEANAASSAAAELSRAKPK